MKMLSNTKTERQIITVKKFLSVKKGIFQACPRFGKTRVGIMIIKELLNMYDIYKHSEILLRIIVPSDIIRTQWIQQIALYFVNTLSDVQIKQLQNSVITANEYEKYSDFEKIKPHDFIIIDEIHRFLFSTGSISTSLKKVNAEFLLCLTGVEIHNMKYDKVTYGEPFDIITEDEAIDNGWIAPYIEYNIPLHLSKNDKSRYTIYSKRIADILDLFKGIARRITQHTGSTFFKDDMQVIYACYGGAKYKGGYISSDKIRLIVSNIMGWSKNLDVTTIAGKSINDNWNPDVLYEISKEFKKFVTARNDIIVHNRVKIESILKIININPVPTIIFNDSTDMVNEITDAIRDYAIAYHSNIKSRPIYDSRYQDYIRYGSGAKIGEIKNFGKVKLKEEAINGIKIGKYKYLVTAKALDEGLDIPNIRQVITTSGSTNPTQHLQRVGRGKTIDEGVSKFTVIINLYFDDFYNDTAELIKSRDKQKLKARQSKLLTIPIELASIEQLNYIFDEN